MALDIHNVHKVEHDTRTNQMILVGSKPYKRFVQEGELPINVQEGKFYYDEGGSVIPPEDVPNWVAKQLKLISADALSRLGFGPRIEPDPIPDAELPKGLGSNDREPIASSEDEEPEDILEPIEGVDEDEFSEDSTEDPLTLELVLDTLEHDEPSHWNTSGKPDLNHLKEMMGRYVSRRIVDEIAPDLIRKA